MELKYIPSGAKRLHLQLASHWNSALSEEQTYLRAFSQLPITTPSTQVNIHKHLVTCTLSVLLARSYPCFTLSFSENKRQMSCITQVRDCLSKVKSYCRYAATGVCMFAYMFFPGLFPQDDNDDDETATQAQQEQQSSQHCQDVSPSMLALQRLVLGGRT